MSDVVDLRAAVLDLATPGERGAVRPAGYELNPPVLGVSLIRTFRRRLPALGPFIVTGLLRSSPHDVNSMRLLIDDLADGAPPRSISEGDIPLLMVPSDSSPGMGSGMPAPIYIAPARAVILETISSVGDAGDDFHVLLEGLHVPQSLFQRARDQLGEVFFLNMLLTANVDTPTTWEVPDGAHLYLDSIHGALNTGTMNTFDLEVGGVRLFPQSDTHMDAFSFLAGGQSLQPHLALEQGDVIKATPAGLNTSTLLSFLFARF